MSLRFTAEPASQGERMTAAERASDRLLPYEGWIVVRSCETERRIDGVFVAGPGPTFENGWRNAASPSDESATCPSGDDTCNCVPDEKIPSFAGVQRCFSACRESLAGQPCACAPSWKADPLSDPTSRQGANADAGLSRIAPCPLGAACLGDGETCFFVWGFLYSATLGL